LSGHFRVFRGCDFGWAARGAHIMMAVIMVAVIGYRPVTSP
jgi:hypothetical protein